jgi:hypothetical protein
MPALIFVTVRKKNSATFWAPCGLRSYTLPVSCTWCKRSPVTPGGILQKIVTELPCGIIVLGTAQMEGLGDNSGGKQNHNRNHNHLMSGGPCSQEALKWMNLRVRVQDLSCVSSVWILATPQQKTNSCSGGTSVLHLEGGVIMRPECVINVWHRPACNVRLPLSSRSHTLPVSPEHAVAISWLFVVISKQLHCGETLVSTFNQFLFSTKTLLSPLRIPTIIWQSPIYHLPTNHHNVSSASIFLSIVLSTTCFCVCVCWLTSHLCIHTHTHTHTYFIWTPYNSPNHNTVTSNGKFQLCSKLSSWNIQKPQPSLPM